MTDPEVGSHRISLFGGRYEVSEWSPLGVPVYATDPGGIYIGALIVGLKPGWARVGLFDTYLEADRAMRFKPEFWDPAGRPIEQPNAGLRDGATGPSTAPPL